MKDVKNITELYKNFFHALTNENLDAISKALYEYCLHPVVIYDTLFDVISLCPNQKINDPIWDNIFQQKRIPADMLRIFTQNHMIKAFWDSDQPQLVNWALLSDAPRLVAAIRVDGNVVGSVGIVYDKNEIPSADDTEAISLAAQALSVYFKQKKQLRATSQPLHDTFAVALLEGDVTTMETLSFWENVSGTTFKNDIRVIAVDCEVKEVARAVYSRIQGNIVGSRNMLMCCLNQSLYFIQYNLPCQNKSEYLRKMGAIFSVLQFENVSVGVSSAITDPTALPLARYQAEQALRIVRALGSSTNIAFYEDHVFDDILHKLKENPFNRSYIHPAVLLLQQTDKDLGSDYANTLKVYVECFCSKTRACHMLNIHRNTLAYRLENIQKLTDIDLEDVQTCRHLLASYALLDCSE